MSVRLPAYDSPMARHLIAATEHVTRSQAVIARSAQRIELTLTLIKGSQRRLLSVIRGGALADEPSNRDYIRDRVRRFIPPPTWKAPTVDAGPGLGHRNCAVCGRAILRGATEYELHFESVTVTLDRLCFALWQSEVARN